MMKYWNEWRWWIISLIGILILAFFVRYINLTSLPIFADEAIYIRWAQVMRAESTLRFLPLSDGKQPLFMWLIIPFLKIINDPLIAGRMTSVFSGLGTIVGIFIASYLLFSSKKIALISAFVYTLVPFAVFFERMALSDSLLTMFGVWVFTVGILLVKTLRLDVAMILGFALGGALLTKSPALYFSLLLPILLILLKNKREIVRYLILLIPTYIIGYGMYNILRLGPNFHLLASRNMDYVWPLSHILTSPFDPFKPFLNRSRQFYWIMGTAGLFASFLLAYYANYKTKTKELLILTIWFLFPILVSSEFSKTMTARYVFFSLPYFVIIASSFFLTKIKWFKFDIYILGSLFLIQSLVFHYNLISNPTNAFLPRSERSGYLEEWTAGQGIREIAKFLNDESKNNPNTNIIVGTEGYFGTLPDGLQIYFDKNPKINVIGIGLELDKIPASLVSAKKAGNKVYLMANNERMNTDFDKLNTKKIGEYPKETRPNGTMQSLMFYEILK